MKVYELTSMDYNDSISEVNGARICIATDDKSEYYTSLELLELIKSLINNNVVLDVEESYNTLSIEVLGEDDENNIEFLLLKDYLSEEKKRILKNIV